MMRVRSNINLSGMRAGSEHDVDETKPRIAALLSSGKLVPVAVDPGRFVCWEHQPPQVFGTQDDLEFHRSQEHTLLGVVSPQGVGEEEDAAAGSNDEAGG
jgi:hypothetical protein